MNTVPPVGPANAKIVIVGEAPGAEEDRLRKPFVGASGQKLDEMLHSAQLARSSIYITNVIKQRPPRNDISKYISFGRGKPKISDEFLLACDALKTELETVKPNVVCAMGNTALFALTGEESITDWRGSIVESTLVPGLKVIPTIHPAAALRQYLYIHQITHDLLKVKRESEYPEIRKPPFTAKLKPSFDEAMAYLDLCKAAKMVAVDIEVVSQEIECLAFALSPSDSCCIVLYDQVPVYSLEEEAQLWCRIGELLEDQSVVKLFQNGVFDCTFIFERFGIRTRNIQDTMIAQGLVTPDMPKSLAFITSIYTDFSFYKGEGKEWYKNPAGSPEGFWRYNCLDTLTCYAAFYPLMQDIDRMGLRDTYNSHVALIPILMDMQARGIRMDKDKMATESIRCKERIEELTKALKEAVGFDLNPKSPKQLQNYFYVQKGIKPYVKDGSPTTDEKAMIKIAAKGHIEAQIVLEIRKLAKLNGTYLEVDLDGDRLKCSYNPIGTSTGRLSSSKNIFGKGTNLQNQPYEMKAMMFVDAGYIGYNMDLSGADSRFVAFCGPVPLMKEAYEKGIDLHSLTASLLFGIPIDAVSREKGSSDIGNGMYSQRDWGKKMNHSSNYGIGKRELSYRLEITEKEAGILLAAYHAQYPEVRSNFQNQIVQMLRNGRRVFNPFGRSRLFLDRWGETLFQDAYAFFPQSGVADIINRRGLVVLCEFVEVEILNQVHDSIVFQIPACIPLERHAAILNALRTSLEQPIQWKATSFVVPADFEMIRSSFVDTVKLVGPFSAESLEAALNR